MAAERLLRTLVVDDEPLAVERLQIVCAGLPAIKLVGTAADGDAALRMIAALAPDLVLLDVAMPGLDGVEVARVLDGHAPAPAVIFCTAHQEYALAAFEVAAVDYLLKPVAPERLERAIVRALARNSRAAPDPASRWLEEIWVPHRSEMIRVATADIERIEAERDYMRLHVGARSFLLHQTLSRLEQRLDPERFIRLHRSSIVRRDAIVGLRHEAGVWIARLRGGADVRVARSCLPAAKALMATR